MAVIRPMALIDSMSGKVCMHSDVSFRTNKRSGSVSSMKMCNPTVPTAATQLAAQAKFATAIANAKAILAATASDTDTTNYNKLLAYKTQYDNHPTYGGSLFNWIFTKERALLDVASE